MQQRVKESLFWMMHKSGGLGLFRQGASRFDVLQKRFSLPLPKRGTLIYMLHQITEAATPFRHGIAVEQFDAFCYEISKHYDVLPLDELEMRRRNGRLPSKAIALTFDDGHADNYHLALPILRRYNLPATVFVTTGFIDGLTSPWSTRVALMLEKANTPAGPLSLDGVPLSLATLQERLATQKRLNAHFQHMDQPKMEDLMAELAELLNVDIREALKKEILTWDEIKDMDSHGFCAGAHTVMHPFLTRIPLDQAKEEMGRSKEIIEGHLGRKVESFAYPNGKSQDYNADIMKAAQEVGYSCAVTARFGANDQYRNPYDLRRVGLYGTLSDAMVHLERFFYATQSEVE